MSACIYIKKGIKKREMDENDSYLDFIISKGNENAAAQKPATNDAPIWVFKDFSSPVNVAITCLA